MLNNKAFFPTLILFCTLFLSLHISGHSQNQEMGLRLANLQNFDFIYKKERRENRFIRYRVAFAGFGVNLQNNRESVNGQLGLAIGFENRRPINDDLFFIHGIEPYLGFSVASNRNITNWVINPSLGYVIGFLYNVSDEFSINLETIPSVNFGASLRNNGENIYTGTVGFNSNAIAVTFAYRFKNKGDK